jgi:transcriptional regulator with XRE-family HTH domain
MLDEEYYDEIILPEEAFGVMVKLAREIKKWTQENLADESGVPLRTVQRVEAGKGFTDRTKGLLLRAFGIKDKNCFEKPMKLLKKEKIEKELKLVTLKKITTGQSFRCLIEESDAYLFDCLEEPSAEVNQVIAEFKDYCTEYRVVSDCYDEVGKLSINAKLQEMMDKILDYNMSIGSYSRKVYLEPDNWQLRILYIVIRSSLDFPEKVFIPKRVEFS